MGDLKVGTHFTEANRQDFMRALLADVHALERILDESRLESGIVRIGAEQEMFLVDSQMRPMPIALDVLKKAEDKRLTGELALFNLEANLSPQLFTGGCFKAMRLELEEVLTRARSVARTQGAEILLAGILPTLKITDLGYENMTPEPRYYELDRIIRQERGGDLEVNIRGLDELQVSHNNVMLESCNTSLQLHLQVDPALVPTVYNIAQTVTAPLLAVAVNSPILLGRRLWSETRVALFEHSVDLRSVVRREKGDHRRVYFGDGWLHGSALEHFRENISRFRPIMLCSEMDADPHEVLNQGSLPRLTALGLHSGTIYRWNRICYGVANGIGHLRIENRVLPSGPTITDEIANAAFFFGMMVGLSDELSSVHDKLRFDDAKDNFFKAARHGLDAQLRWVDGRAHPVVDLILSQLLPAARSGLKQMGVDADDIDHYLGVIETRVRSQRTGAQWVLDSLVAMEAKGDTSTELQHRALVRSMLEQQSLDTPISGWPLAEVRPHEEPWIQSLGTVGQVMTTDLFSARPDDIIDLAANLMDWHQVRHVPIESEGGKLVGLVSHRAILRAYTQRSSQSENMILVQDVMLTDPVTVTPSTPTLEAMQTMRNHRISALPVVDGGRIVGIITERDLVAMATRLLERLLDDENGVGV